MIWELVNILYRHFRSIFTLGIYIAFGYGSRLLSLLGATPPILSKLEMPRTAHIFGWGRLHKKPVRCASRLENAHLRLPLRLQRAHTKDSPGMLIKMPYSLGNRWLVASLLGEPHAFTPHGRFYLYFPN